MAKTFVKIGDGNIEVKFDLNDQGRVGSLKYVKYAESRQDVNLDFNNMRGKIVDAVNCILTQGGGHIEFGESGKKPKKPHKNKQEHLAPKQRLTLDELKIDLATEINVTPENVENVFTRDIKCGQEGTWTVVYSSKGDEAFIMKENQPPSHQRQYELGIQQTKKLDKITQQMVPVRTLMVTARPHRPDPFALGLDTHFSDSGASPDVDGYQG